MLGSDLQVLLLLIIIITLPPPPPSRLLFTNNFLEFQLYQISIRFCYHEIKQSIFSCRIVHILLKNNMLLATKYKELYKIMIIIFHSGCHSYFLWCLLNLKPLISHFIITIRKCIFITVITGFDMCKVIPFSPNTAVF